jgi:DNA-binding PadR family transcriptional regulator
MTIRHALVALLAEGDQYGYELRQRFEDRSGGAWPLNIGQVYTTLDRLVRDGLVERAAATDDRQVHYALTDAGREAAAGWWADPEPAAGPGRDDVVLKIALAIASPQVDARAVIQTQRHEAMAQLQQLSASRRASDDSDPTWTLVADALSFKIEAQLRWLDHTDQQVINGQFAKESVPQTHQTPARRNTAVTS